VQGIVTLDDIAKLYDVYGNPDVKHGRKAGDCYTEVIQLWDT